MQEIALERRRARTKKLNVITASISNDDRFIMPEEKEIETENNIQQIWKNEALLRIIGNHKRNISQ